MHQWQRIKKSWDSWKTFKHAFVFSKKKKKRVFEIHVTKFVKTLKRHWKDIVLNGTQPLAVYILFCSLLTSFQTTKDLTTCVGLNFPNHQHQPNTLVSGWLHHPRNLPIHSLYYLGLTNDNIADPVISSIVYIKTPLPGYKLSFLSLTFTHTHTNKHKDTKHNGTRNWT